MVFTLHSEIAYPTVLRHAVHSVRAIYYEAELDRAGMRLRLRSQACSCHWLRLRNAPLVRDPAGVYTRVPIAFRALGPPVFSARIAQPFCHRNDGAGSFHHAGAVGRR